MIGKLKGFVDSSFEDAILFNVSGVCYYVFLDKKTIFEIKDRDFIFDLFIETIVREFDTFLYGFLTFEDQVWFKNLIKLNGISGKIAIGIIGSFDIKTLSFAIKTKDEKLISTVPGIGKKLANRIVNELSDITNKVSQEVMFYQKNRIKIKGGTEFIKDEHFIDDRLSSDIYTDCSNVAMNNYKIIQDGIEAICSLGFSRQATYTIVQKYAKEKPNISLEELIKISLKSLDER